LSTASVPPTQSEPFKPGLVARAIAAFSGTPGLVIKIVLLALTNGVAVWAGVVLVDRSRWVALAILTLATAAIDEHVRRPCREAVRHREQRELHRDADRAREEREHARHDRASGRLVRQSRAC
jgi:hypothetical protein